MNIKQITQSDVQSVFKILKVVNNHNYALITEIAKELKVSKIDLAKHVIDHQKLFYAENIFSYKEVKVKRRLWPNDAKSTYTTSDMVPNKNLGMGLKEVYLNAVENYRTSEWLANQITTMSKYLHISEVDNYGMIEGYYISTDVKKEKLDDDKYRCYQWRNTLDKVEWFKENGFTHPSGFTIGGFGDSYSFKVENSIALNKINELKLLGWTTNKFNPLANYISSNG